jgi:uncharacterized protein YndB with AHSA1/START domain
MKINPDKNLEKETIVPLSAAQVWEKWTTKEGLKSFFGEDNFIELRLNGPFEIYFLMDNPYGLRGSEGCRILSYLPEKMLSFTWNAPPQFEEIREEKEHTTWVVIQFVLIDKKHTKVELNHFGWPGTKKWEAVYQYFDSAWDKVLDSLENSCEDEE